MTITNEVGEIKLTANALTEIRAQLRNITNRGLAASTTVERRIANAWGLPILNLIGESGWENLIETIDDAYYYVTKSPRVTGVTVSLDPAQFTSVQAILTEWLDLDYRADDGPDSKESEQWRANRAAWNKG